MQTLTILSDELRNKRKKLAQLSRGSKCYQTTQRNLDKLKSIIASFSGKVPYYRCAIPNKIQRQMGLKPKLTPDIDFSLLAQETQAFMQKTKTEVIPSI